MTFQSWTLPDKILPFILISLIFLAMTQEAMTEFMEDTKDVCKISATKLWGTDGCDWRTFSLSNDLFWSRWLTDCEVAGFLRNREGSTYTVTTVRSVMFESLCFCAWFGLWEANKNSLYCIIQFYKSYLTRHYVNSEKKNCQYLSL